MSDKKLDSKQADVPKVQPGFKALDMSDPFIVQMNAEGKWESRKPENMDEAKLKAIIQHLANSVAKDQQPKTTPQDIAILMIPTYSADDCPLDKKCELRKIKDAEQTKVKQMETKEQMETKGEEETDDDKKKPKNRGYQLQRLTDFDLLSQW